MPVQVLNVGWIQRKVSLKNDDWFSKPTLKPTKCFFKECKKCFLLKNANALPACGTKKRPSETHFLESTNPLILQWKCRAGGYKSPRCGFPFLRACSATWASALLESWKATMNSLVVEPTHLKNMIVKLNHFPQGLGWNYKKLKPPPSEVRDFILWSLVIHCDDDSKVDSQVLNMEWVKGLILQGCRNISRDGPLKG